MGYRGEWYEAEGSTVFSNVFQQFGTLLCFICHESPTQYYLFTYGNVGLCTECASKTICCDASPVTLLYHSTKLGA